MKVHADVDNKLLQEDHVQHPDDKIANLEEIGSRQFSGRKENRKEDTDFGFFKLEVERFREKFLLLATNRYDVTLGPRIIKDITYTLDVSRDMETLKKDLDSFKEHVLGLALSYKGVLKKIHPEAINDVPRSSTQRKRNYIDILKNLDESYKAFRMKKFNLGNYVSIAKELGLVAMDDSSEKAFKNGDREVRRRLKHADNLIKAAINGTFSEEIENPLPRNI